MSLNSAKAFVNKLTTDEAFVKDVSGKLAAGSSSDRDQAIKKAGYEFTDGELQQALAAHTGGPGVTDQDLEGITGEETVSLHAAGGKTMKFDFRSLKMKQACEDAGYW